MIKQLGVRAAMVHEYLMDLEVALAGADPIERAETLASIREHLEGSLPADASPEQVQQALSALGTPEQIAQVASHPVATIHGEPQAQAVAPRDTSKPDGWSYLVLYGAIASVLFIMVPYLMVPIALACVVGAIWDLRRNTGPRLTAWVALVLANIGFFGSSTVVGFALSIF